MANVAELQFISKMRNAMGPAMAQMKQQFAQAAREMEKVEKNLKEVKTQARSTGSAIQALTGFTAAGFAGSAMLDAFMMYEAGLVGVQKTTNKTEEEINALAESFDGLVQSMRGVTTKQLLDTMVVAGQMGIRANEDLTQFAETLGMLSVATNVQGEKGAYQLSRILTLTKEPIDNIEQVGSVLVALGNTTAATEAEILDMASSLSQSAATFDFSSEAILGLAAAAAQLNFRPELFGAAVARSMVNIKQAAIEGGRGMEALTYMTGLTQERLQELVESQPEAAFMTIVGAAQKIQDAGGNVKSFLDSLNLSAEENLRVIGALAGNYDMMLSKMLIAQAESQNIQAMRAEYEIFSQQLSAFGIAAKNAWEAFSFAMVGSLKDVLTGGLQLVTDILYGLTDLFISMPDAVQTAVGTITVMGIALGSLAFTIGTVALLFGGSFTGAIKAVALALVGLGTASGVVAFGLGAVGTAILALTAAAVLPPIFDAINSAIEGMLPDSVVQKWRDFKELLNSDGWVVLNPFGGLESNPAYQIYKYLNKDDAKEAGKGAGEAIAAGVEEGMKALADMSVEEIMALPTEMKERLAGVAITSAVAQTLSDTDRAALAELDTWTRAEQKVQAYDRALKNLRAISKDVADDPVLDQATQGTIRRLEVLAERARIMADPFLQRIDNMDKAIAKAQAITAEAKAEHEIQEAITALLEERGEVTAGEQSLIRSRMVYQQTLETHETFTQITQDMRDQLELAQAVTDAEKVRVQAAQAAADFARDNARYTQEQLDYLREMTEVMERSRGVQDFNTQLQDLDNQIALASELNLVERSRLEINQKIATIQRNNSAVGPDQVTALRSRMEALNEIERQTTVIDKIWTQAANQRLYEADLQTLKEMNLSTEQMEYATTRLNQIYKETIDPLYEQKRTMQENIEILHKTGEFAQADIQSLQTINRLREKGLEVSQEMEESLVEYNRLMEQANKWERTGVQGFVNEVGSLRDNLLDLEKDFATGLADAVSGALTGDPDSIRQFVHNFAKEMNRVAVRQLMATLFDSFGMENPFADPAQVALDKFTEAARNITTPQAIITAAQVSLNGNIQGGPMEMPAMPQMPGGPAAGPMVANIPITDHTAAAIAAIGTAEQQMAASIQRAAAELGILAEDLATVISYETGGSMDPAERGGAGNRHIGLIQFGIPEQKQYGAHQGQTFDEQMDAVVRYLKDRGLQPGMGMLDLYSTINAGSPGRYGASDANNGGAPGNVRDKVQSTQMQQHRIRAQEILASLETQLVEFNESGTLINRDLEVANAKLADAVNVTRGMADQTGNLRVHVEDPLVQIRNGIGGLGAPTVPQGLPTPYAPPDRLIRETQREVTARTWDATAESVTLMSVPAITGPVTLQVPPGVGDPIQAIEREIPRLYDVATMQRAVPTIQEYSNVAANTNAPTVPNAPLMAEQSPMFSHMGAFTEHLSRANQIMSSMQEVEQTQVTTTTNVNSSMEQFNTHLSNALAIMSRAGQQPILPEDPTAANDLRHQNNQLRQQEIGVLRDNISAIHQFYTSLTAVNEVLRQIQIEQAAGGAAGEFVDPALTGPGIPGMNIPVSNFVDERLMGAANLTTAPGDTSNTINVTTMELNELNMALERVTQSMMVMAANSAVAPQAQVPGVQAAATAVQQLGTASAQAAIPTGRVGTAVAETGKAATAAVPTMGQFEAGLTGIFSGVMAGLTPLLGPAGPLVGMVVQKIFSAAMGAMSGAGGAAAGGAGGMLSSIFGALFKFDTGGWTGDVAKEKVAGVVHGQEFVVKAGPAKKNIELLTAMNEGKEVPGYFLGGLVGSAFGRGSGLGASPGADIFAGVLHAGGEVGTTRVPSRMVPANIFTHAPRLHNGFRNDEFAAVLQRNERVITEDQNSRLMRVMGAMDNRRYETRTSQSSSAVNVNYQINTPDADSFRASQQQILSRSATAMRRAQRNF